MVKFYATTDPEVSEREKKNQTLSRKIAAEGMVLLENNGILPMHLKGKKIALFGSGARHTIQGGTGSGEVNTRTVSTVEHGLENAGAQVVTKAWLDRYDSIVLQEKEKHINGLKERYSDAPEMAFWAMFSYRNPLTIPLEAQDMAASDESIAIYVLSRNSGEGSDRRNVPGDYQIHEEEKNLLRTLCGYYKHVIVVLNVGGVMDTSFLRTQSGIDAVLLMGQAGNSGGDALADVLSGKVAPSGHLTTTWAEQYEDYPSAETFGYMNGNRDDEYYTENIYIGYRWFDSFGKTPAYPFGYGKTYTKFAVDVMETDVKDHRVCITVRVTNVGDRYSGREVVQAYISAPDGRLEKPYQELMSYTKTRELQPQESEILTLEFPVKRMASYDERHAAWILEKGDYILRVGTHSRATKIAAIIQMEKECICEQLTNVLPLDCKMECVHADRNLFYSYPEEKAEIRAAKKIHIEEIKEQSSCVEAEPLSVMKTEKQESFLTMLDVQEGRCKVSDLVRQLTVEEMTLLCVGTARGGQEESSTIGAASTACPGAAGDTTSELLETRRVRNIILADGPAGLRLSPRFIVDHEQKVIKQDAALGSGFMDAVFKPEEKKIPADAVTHYQYCTGIPTETLLAQTWDIEALYIAGDIIGSEMEEFGITLWLAPGMNIHRNPLCGRNFEYYSEDPIVSGFCAAAETQGVQAHSGVGTTIKHFACNNLEDNRAYNISHVTERALREIYLRGFEIAVKASQPMSIMSSYNFINGVHAANSRDLLTKVAREEWGFAGIVMTDWGTTAEAKPDLEGRLPVYGCSNAAGCIKAGNDLIMPGSQEDIDEILRSVGAEKGSVKYPLTVEELRVCAERMLTIIAKSNAYGENKSYTESLSCISLEQV